MSGMRIVAPLLCLATLAAFAGPRAAWGLEGSGGSGTRALYAPAFIGRSAAGRARGGARLALSCPARVQRLRGGGKDWGKFEAEMHDELLKGVWHQSMDLLASRVEEVSAEQPAPAPHLALPEGRAVRTHMCFLLC